jgi:hypothetical protein
MMAAGMVARGNKAEIEKKKLLMQYCATNIAELSIQKMWRVE